MAFVLVVTIPPYLTPLLLFFNPLDRFIKQEADEKSSEIAVAAEEEFNITKLQLLEGEKAKVRRDFDRKQVRVNHTPLRVPPCPSVFLSVSRSPGLTRSHTYE